MEKTIPLLRVSDYDKAIDYYIKWLGFKIDWEKKPDDGPFRIQISFRETITLQLLQFETAEGLGTWILIEDFKNLVIFRKFLGMKPAKYPTPPVKHFPEDKSILTLTFQDPFRNLIELRQQN